MRYNIDNTSRERERESTRESARREKRNRRIGKKKKKTRMYICESARSTEKRATRGRRSNYVFRESTESHSTEELWIAARCQDAGAKREPFRTSSSSFSSPVTFSIGTTDKRSKKERGKNEREEKRRRRAMRRRHDEGEINGAM